MTTEKEFLSYLDCLDKAETIINNPELFKTWNNIDDVEVLANILFNLKKEKEEQSVITDTYLDYDDEIISIEELDEIELMDITVSGDNLFYANDILTKNSHGISMTCDMMFALISTPELEQLGHVRIKQLKNRFGDLFKPNSFLVGLERAKMNFYDVDLPNNIISQPHPKEEIENLSDDDVMKSKFKKGMKF